MEIEEHIYKIKQVVNGIDPIMVLYDSQLKYPSKLSNIIESNKDLPSYIKSKVYSTRFGKLLLVFNLELLPNIQFKMIDKYIRHRKVNQFDLLAMIHRQQNLLTAKLSPKETVTSQNSCKLMACLPAQTILESICSQFNNESMIIWDIKTHDEQYIKNSNMYISTCIYDAIRPNLIQMEKLCFERHIIMKPLIMVMITLYLFTNIALCRIAKFGNVQENQINEKLRHFFTTMTLNPFIVGSYNRKERQNIIRNLF